MKWAILLGSPDIGGGTYVIFEHAIRAKRKGIDVCIITEEKVNTERLNWHPEARELTWMTIESAKTSEFDIVIATWWRTVYEMYKLKANTYAYFVQSIESRFYPENEIPLRKLVDSTYMLPLKIITEATWIKSYLKENYNKDAYLVLNGIRKDIYSECGQAHEKRNSGRLRVLVEGPVDVKFKNVPKTIELCKKSLADEIWLLTSSPVKSYPGVNRVYSRVPIFETPMIYRSCDVVIKLSYVEGMFGPPLEMFHCGGTAITYNVTGHDEYIKNGYNALVANTDDENAVVNFINDLKNDKSILEKLKNGSKDTAEIWPNWDEAAIKFENVVNQICLSESLGQAEIEKSSKFFFDFYVIAENYRLSKINNTYYKKCKTILSNKFPILYTKLRNLKFKIKYSG